MKFPALYIDTTRECNLACPLCMSGSNDSSLVESKKPDQLTKSEIIDHLLKPAKKLGALLVQLGGGEFLLRPDSLEIIAESCALGIEPRVLTNGVILTEHLVKEIKAIGGKQVVIIFGINSVSDGNFNSWSRDSHFDVAMNALSLCKKYGIRTHVNVNVSRQNSQDLDTTLIWLKQNRLSANRSPLVPRGSGKEFYKQNRITKELMEQVIHPVYLRHFDIALSYTPFFLSPELHSLLSGRLLEGGAVAQNPHIGCWTGSLIAVGAEGEVSPCMMLIDHVRAGSIRETPLEIIVNESPVFKGICDRTRLEGKCGRCRYKNTCGGCRALAFYETGNLYAEDPTCFFDPDNESSISPLEDLTSDQFRMYFRLARKAGWVN